MSITRNDAEMALVVDGVAVKYPGNEFGDTLHEVSFSVPDGAFWSVVGASGCGKSTLLSAIAGLTPIKSGSVTTSGEILSDPKAEFATLIFQDPILLPWRTAIDNIAFPLELRKQSKSIRTAKARELLKLVGLEQYADYFPHQLSGGMRQRIAIARGLILEPKILLMDEPFAAIDEQERQRLGDELLRIWSSTQTTILFVTHSLSEAVYLSDRVLVLKGRPSSLVSSLEINLPRPRKPEIMDDISFVDLRRSLRASLGEE